MQEMRTNQNAEFWFIVVHLSTISDIVWHYSCSEWMQLAKSRFKTRCLDSPAKCLSRGWSKAVSFCLSPCLSCQCRSFFKKYIFIKRKSYELKSFFVFLVGDAANEEDEEGGGWRSYVYCSSWKSFTWCSHIRRLDSRTQSRKGKQPITSSSLWRNRSHSCSYGRTWFSKEWRLISFETRLWCYCSMYK